MQLNCCFSRGHVFAPDPFTCLSGLSFTSVHAAGYSEAFGLGRRRLRLHLNWMCRNLTPKSLCFYQKLFPVITLFPSSCAAGLFQEMLPLY